MRTAIPGILCTLLLFHSPAQAQDLAATFVKSGVADASSLLKAYLSTTMKGFGQGCNDGWNNTAKPLTKGGIDLRLNLGFGFVTAKDRSYDFNSIGLNADHNTPYLKLEPGAGSRQPTIYGDQSDAPPQAQVRFSYAGFDTMLTSFPMPTGTNYPYSPSLPMVQGSFGIFHNTEVSLRVFPALRFPGKYRIGFLGLGIKHDLIQYIPAYSHLSLKDKRPFDWSVFAGFTSFLAEYNGLKLLLPDSFAYNPDPSVNYNKQVISFTGSGITAGTIVSKELGNTKFSISPFLGLNYAYSMTRLRMKGNYPVPVPNDQYSPAHPQLAKVQAVKDPIDQRQGFSNVRMNAGLRFKVWLFSLSAEYSFGAYNTANIGMAINIQNFGK